MNKLKYLCTLQTKIIQWLFQGKVIILYGPRQVGKTTLANEIITGQSRALYLNCERQQVWELLNSGNQDRIRQYLGDAKLVVFYEARKISQIGSFLKIVD